MTKNSFSYLFFNVSAFYFFFFSIIGVYVIYMPKVLELKGYSSFEIGVVFAMSPLMRFITPFFFLKHLFLTKKLFFYSLVLSLISGILFYLTINNFYLFLIPNILLGISFALILPYAETIALQKIGKENYGKSRLFGSIGFIIIALVLAKFMDNHSYSLHFLFITILFTTFFGYKIAEYEEDMKESSNKNNTFSLVLHWRFWISAFLMQVSFGPFYNFFTIYETSHGLSYETVSYLWTFGVLCEIFMLYFQTPLMRKNLLFLIKISIFSAVVRWFLLFLYPDSIFIAYFTQSLHAFSFALYYSAAIAYLFQIYENKKLAQQFFGGISFGLGGFIGSILAGIFYGKYIFLYASFIALLSLLVILKTKNNNL
ncbi:MFS transporter [Nitrosophilus labii]|uniref:MFS transporter n=1 Tax=Nitrosophilus labii TaxID=2706014 RepID=UPI0018D7D445|nr:MFS transporter [Nitrosophilus labii]